MAQPVLSFYFIHAAQVLGKPLAYLIHVFHQFAD